VLAEITDSGRAVVEAATRDLVAAEFGVGVLSREQLAGIAGLLTPIRQAAGDFVEG
jgi:hypothetical protein